MVRGYTLFLNPLSDEEVENISRIPWISAVERTGDFFGREIRWLGDLGTPTNGEKVNMVIEAMGSFADCEPYITNNPAITKFVDEYVCR